MKYKKVLLWILAVIISLAAMVYQRMTGPTYPKDIHFVYEGTEYKTELPRSHGGITDCPVELKLPEPFNGKIIWRKFPAGQAWDTLSLVRTGDSLKTALPHQPPAGKLEYRLELSANGRPVNLGETEHVVIRFKGAVPGWALLPHVLLMVLTVIWSMVTIFFALANFPEFKKHVGITTILLLIGGFILGPVVQKYSFGQFWTGWPLGEDLTDNKVLFALIAFLIAWAVRNKPYGRWVAVGAALVMLAVYLIPHSMNGSEMDYETGEVVTGAIILLPVLFRQQLSSSQNLQA